MKKRPKDYKIKVKIESERLLIILKFKIYLIYMFIKNTMIKTPFMKLYELKTLLILEEVSNFINIRSLNDVAITENFIKERISLNLFKSI